jgi:hypothetical protein
LSSKTTNRIAKSERGRERGEEGACVCAWRLTERGEKESVFDGRDKNALRERRVKEKEMGRERKRERVSKDIYKALL